MMSFVQSHAVAAINGRFVMNSKYNKYIHEKALKLPEIRSKIIEIRTFDRFAVHVNIN